MCCNQSIDYGLHYELDLLMILTINELLFTRALAQDETINQLTLTDLHWNSDHSSFI